MRAIEYDQEYSCYDEKEHGDCICDSENADDGVDDRCEDDREEEEEETE